MIRGLGRNFYFYWASRGVSKLGSALTMVALPLLVFNLSGSPALTSLMVVADTTPMILFGMVGGAVGDMWPRRTIMVLADICSALALFSIVACSWLGELSVAVVLVAGFISQTGEAMYDGANWGATPALVKRDSLDRANGLVWGTQSLMEFAGPGLVGMLLVVMSPSQVVLFDVISFAASAVLVRAVSTTMSDETSSQTARIRNIPHEIANGLRYLRSQAGLTQLVGVGTAGSAAVGAMFGILVPWAVEGLDVPSSGWMFSVMMASWSLGATVGAFATGRMRAGERAIFVTRRLTFVASLCCFALAVVTAWWIAAAILVAYLFCHTAQYMSVITLRQRIVPSSYLSRVNAASRVVSYGVGTVGGAALGGYLASRFGYPAVLSFAGVLHLSSCLISWSPKLSALERKAQAEFTSTV
ncbi:MFS transporter [Streptomyces phaeochromogenes]|uniref:MFS transporter n=1 Tax=Streptomyces phaeochromogenes TaxID=1923 RepID=UPI0033CA62B0